MRRSTETKISTIIAAVVIVLMTCGGVLMGLIEEWPRMVLNFLLVVYVAEGSICLLLHHEIESRFMQLEELITGKAVPDRLVINFVPKSIIIAILIFIAAVMPLSMFAVESSWWLALCILVAMFLIGNYVITGLIVWLKFKTCSKRLEGLISSNREGSS